MRRLIFFFLALIGSCVCSLACGPYERGYVAGQYNLFHLSIPEAQKYDKTREMNIADWQMQTSRAIPAEEVEDVVYKWPLARVAALLESNPETGGNKFALWLVNHKDTVAIKCLILAKRCERARASQLTKWYYHSENALEYKTLDSICSEVRLYKGKRLADRYAFQAIRALFGMSCYKRCVDYWNKHRKVFTPGTAVYCMAEDYAIGCTQRISGKKKSYAEAFSAMPEIEWPLREIGERINNYCCPIKLAKVKKALLGY